METGIIQQQGDTPLPIPLPSEITTPLGKLLHLVGSAANPYFTPGVTESIAIVIKVALERGREPAIELLEDSLAFHEQRLRDMRSTEGGEEPSEETAQG